MCLKCGPRASRARPEPRNGPSRVRKGGPRGSQNESKITFLKALGHRCGTKGSQGLSRCPLRFKMEPKWFQNGTKNGATTHMIETSAVPQSSTEMREKLAYPQNSPEVREAGIPSEHPEKRQQQCPHSSTAAIKCPCLPRRTG